MSRGLGDVYKRQATATTDAQASSTADASADADPGTALSITIGKPMIQRSQQQTAIGTGFTPGETVTGVMDSDSIAVGSRVADEQGTVNFAWTIPANADLGTHTVTLTGPQSGSVAGTFRVVTSGSGLATTGGELLNGGIALGILLVMVGLGAALVFRSRREATLTQ